jgi:myo-inositol-1(or 4)-monophosphatase
MKPSEQRDACVAAVQAARAAGKLIRQNQNAVKKISLISQHDIKLEMDVSCQKLIERMLCARFPRISILGEEGSVGQPQADLRWVVDPIDGTVNFTYGIPHVCVSIALQERLALNHSKSKGCIGRILGDEYQTLIGVVFDPFSDELWTAVRDRPPRLNGQVIRTSKRRRLKETVVSVGFSKTAENLRLMLPYFNQLVHRVRKIRIMGSAALGLAYIACGRFDAYIEGGVRLWDVAAGALLVECAGGEFWHRPIPGESYAYRMVASNGLLRAKLQPPL